jgi:3-oxoacyl-[acyl-carrier protein] reductase
MMDRRPVVLLTGASRGIGGSIAAALAARGARLALVYSARAEQAETVRQALDRADDHRAFQCDITVPALCEQLVRSVVEWAGRLDVLVNNAGVNIDHSDWLSASYQEWQDAWQRTMAVNYYAPCHLSYLALQEFRKQDPHAPPGTGGAGSPMERGRIVNVSSRGAY